MNSSTYIVVQSDSSGACNKHSNKSVPYSSGLVEARLFDPGTRVIKKKKIVCIFTLPYYKMGTNTDQGTM